MKIILIRHGQTEWNKEKIFRGRIDVPLDNVGIRQVNAIAKRILSSFEINTIYSSPLIRALMTAQAIAKPLNLNIKIDDRLIDFNFGEWQGLSLEKVKEKYSLLYHKWTTEPHLTEIPGGENLNSVRTRITKLLNEIIEKEQGDIAIVSHRIVNKVIICTTLSLDNSYFWKIKQDVAAINVIEYNDGIFIISSLNDTCHLMTLKQNRETADF